MQGLIECFTQTKVRQWLTVQRIKWFAKPNHGCNGQATWWEMGNFCPRFFKSYRQNWLMTISQHSFIRFHVKILMQVCQNKWGFFCLKVWESQRVSHPVAGGRFWTYPVEFMTLVRSSGTWHSVCWPCGSSYFFASGKVSKLQAR